MSQTAFSPWQAALWQQLDEIIRSDHMAHGLLLCGAPQLGKRALAERLAQRLLCQNVQAAQPCGQCRSCTLFLAGTHPDYHFVSFIPTKDGSKLRTEITIDQVREIREKLALTPQYGGAQIVVIAPADALNRAAANALLKTLEEPQPGRYLWLISSEPARLPATIRSRCQRLELRMPNERTAHDWLLQQGHSQTQAAQALQIARGHRGLADQWLLDGSLQLRASVADDLQAIANDTAGASEVAQRWSADDDAVKRLAFAADIALEKASNASMQQSMVQIRHLAAWFDKVNQCRLLLRSTARADLAIAECLLQWRLTHHQSSLTGVHHNG